MRVLAKDKTLSEGDRDFYLGKRQAARFYIEWELPQTVQQSELLIPNNRVCFDMQDACF